MSKNIISNIENREEDILQSFRELLSNFKLLAEDFSSLPMTKLKERVFNKAYDIAEKMANDVELSKEEILMYNFVTKKDHSFRKTFTKETVTRFEEIFRASFLVASAMPDYQAVFQSASVMPDEENPMLEVKRMSDEEKQRNIDEIRKVHRHVLNTMVMMIDSYVSSMKKSYMKLSKTEKLTDTEDHHFYALNAYLQENALKKLNLMRETVAMVFKHQKLIEASAAGADEEVLEEMRKRIAQQIVKKNKLVIKEVLSSLTESFDPSAQVEEISFETVSKVYDTLDEGHGVELGAEKVLKSRDFAKEYQEADSLVNKFLDQNSDS